MTLPIVTDGVAHTNEATETEGNTLDMSADLRMHRMEMQLDTLGSLIESLHHSLSDLHTDFKTERFQTNTTLQYLLASLMDLQNRPAQHVHFRWPWERR